MPPIRRARYSERERAEWLENKKAQAAFAEAQAAAEAAAAAEEQKQHMENTESNFPTLSTAHPVSTQRAPNGFANLARDWATSEQQVPPPRATTAEAAVLSKIMPYIPRPIFPTHTATRYHSDWNRDEEDESMPAHTELNEEDRGWTVVQNRKTRKIKRELTIDEMDARERALGDGGDDDGDYQINDDLYESNRHDHH